MSSLEKSHKSNKSNESKRREAVSSIYLLPGMTKNDSVLREVQKYEAEKSNEKVEDWLKHQSRQYPSSSPGSSAEHNASSRRTTLVSDRRLENPSDARDPFQEGVRKAELWVTEATKRATRVEQQRRTILQRAENAGKVVGEQREEDLRARERR